MVRTDPQEIETLKARIEELEAENRRLRRTVIRDGTEEKKLPLREDKDHMGGLCNSDIERYSRQLLLRGGFGVNGQKKLLSSSVLVVGAGGIGSTVILYLAACGVGKITIIDFDEVDVSNLHRQVIHSTKNVGMNKAESARNAIYDLNPSINCEIIKQPLTSSNALGIVSRHTCIVDASDNPQTRYLVNDACVLADKPLVSGSAIGTEGQLTVYNYKGGPCYRCLYPKPDLREGSKSCSDHGVLGPVPGLIGILQSMEAIKVLTGTGEVMSDRICLYDALECGFMRIKKPQKQPRCPICGPERNINSMTDSFEASSSARGPSCSELASFVNLPASQQVSVEEFDLIRQRGDAHILLDVRVPEQFEICSLEGAINIELSQLETKVARLEEESAGRVPVFCICRRGIASAEATQVLNEMRPTHTLLHSVTDIKGGLDAWRRRVDETFPKY